MNYESDSNSVRERKWDDDDTLVEDSNICWVSKDQGGESACVYEMNG